MVDRLEVEVDFSIGADEISGLAKDAVSDVEKLSDLAEQFGQSLQGAFEGISFEDLNTAGLVDAADAFAQLGDVDLSGAAGDAESIAASFGEAAEADLAAASDGLSDGVASAEGIASALTTAADVAGEIGDVGEIDASGAQALSEEMEAAAGWSKELAEVGFNTEDILGFRDAIQQAAKEAGVTKDEFAAMEDQFNELFAIELGKELEAEFSGANAAAQAQSQAMSSATEDMDAAKESTLGVNEAQKDLPSVFDASGAAAAALGNEVTKFTNLATSTTPTVQGLANVLKGLRDDLSAGTGLLAAEGVLVGVGQKFENLTNIITQQTGAVGDALRGSSDTFVDVLGSSDESASDLAMTFGTLQRDMGLTGDSLAALTVQTGDFLAATGGSAADVRSLTQLVHQFGLDAAGTARFQDQLVAVQDKYGGSLSGLLGQVRQAGPILQTLGFNEGQIAGLAAQLDQAGVGLQRLAPKLSAFATSARADGKDAGQAFRDLITEIETLDPALGDTRAIEVFGDKVGPQLATAVRAGAVSLEELDAVLASSTGAASAKADELDGIGAVFAGFGNKIVGALGQIGKDLGDNLGDNIAKLEPVLDAVLELLVAASPAFGTFGQLVGVAAIAIQPLAPVLEVLADVVSAIPDPILAIAGAFIAFNSTPFGRIADGLGNVTGLLGRVKDFALPAKGGLDAAGKGVTGLGGALASINPYALAAAAGLAGVTYVLSQRQQAAAEMKEKVEALGEALGKMSGAASEATPALTDLFALGSKGKLIDDKDAEAFAKLGVTYEQVVGIVQKDLGTEGFGVTRALREEVVRSAGGFQQFVDNLNLPSESNLLEKMAGDAETAAKWEQVFYEQGRIGSLGMEQNTKRAADAINDVADAEDKRAAKTLAAMANNGLINDALIEEAAARGNIADIGANEAAVLAQVNILVGEQAAARAGLGEVTDMEAQRISDITAALEEQGQTEAKLTAAKKSRFEIEASLLGALAGGGDLTDDDRLRAASASGQAGVEAVQAVAEAEQRLLAIRDELAGPTEEFKDAQLLLTDSIARGADPMTALEDAYRSTGVSVDQLKAAYDQIQGAVEKFNAPISESPAAVSAASQAMADGALTAGEYGTVLESVGFNAAQADAALAAAAAGIEASSKAIMEMLPGLGDVLKQLETAPSGDGPDLRLQQYDEEARAIQGLAAVRDADLASRQAQVETAIAISQRQRDLGGPTVDTAALEGQLTSIRGQREAIGAELGLSVEDINRRKVELGEALSSAPPGLGDVFSGMESAINEQMALIETTIALRAEGIDDAVKLAFEFPADERDRFITELAAAGPEARKALEAQAEEIVKGREATDKRAKDAGDIFADENVEANGNAVKRGTELAENFAKGVTEGMSDSDIFAIINAAVEAGVDPETARRVMEEAGLIGGTAYGEATANAMLGSPLAPEVIGSLVATGPDAMAEQGRVAAASWTATANENIIGSPINPETIGGFMAPAAGEMAALGPTAAAAWLEAANATVIGSPVAPETIGGFMAPAAGVMATQGATSGTTYATSTSTGISSNPVPEGVGSGIVAGVGTALSSGGYGAGANYSSGVASGINANAYQAIEAAYAMANAVDAAGNASLASASPSRKGMQTGKWWAEGVAIGIAEAGGLAAEAATKVGRTVADRRIAAEVGALVGPDGTTRVALGDGPGVDRIVSALGRKTPVVRPRRRRPFGGNK